MPTLQDTSRQGLTVTHYECLPRMELHSIHDEGLLADLVNAIVNFEGPVHSEVICQRVLSFCTFLNGYDSSKTLVMRSELLAGIDRACSNLCDDGNVRLIGGFYIQSGMEHWSDVRNPRDAAGRSIDHIWLGEIIAACGVVSRAKQIDHLDDLVAATASAMGISRLDISSRERLSGAAEQALVRKAKEDQQRSLKSNPQLFKQPLVELGYDVVQDTPLRRSFLKHTAVRKFTLEGVRNMLVAIRSSLSDSSSDADLQLQIVSSDIEYVSGLAPQV